MSKTYSTEEAAKLIGITRITLQRWISKKRITPSISVPMRGKTLWRWTPDDIRRAKLLRGTFKPGPAARSKKV
jgi:excisionase family DNA binding protein